MIRLADYVIRSLADWGVTHIFLVTGGGAMHLNDAIGREERIQFVCHHHEQAAAMAAEGYARIKGTPGVVNVTAGPGGINALNGVFGAYTDSIPMLVISGQVKRETCRASLGIEGLRQLGDQEVDIVSMAQGITKYAVLVNDPSTIRYHLERAYYLARTGRPGPAGSTSPSTSSPHRSTSTRCCPTTHWKTKSCGTATASWSTARPSSKNCAPPSAPLFSPARACGRRMPSRNSTASYTCSAFR